MKHIKLFEEFVNEGFTSFADLKKAIKYHEDGNPYYDKTKLINMYNSLKGSDQSKAKKEYSEYFGIAKESLNEAKFTDYSNNELMAYIKNNPKDKEAAKELHKRSQKIKALTRTDELKTVDEGYYSSSDVKKLKEFAKKVSNQIMSEYADEFDSKSSGLDEDEYTPEEMFFYIDEWGENNKMTAKDVIAKFDWRGLKSELGLR